MVIGITGEIASGKTTVAKVLKKLNFYSINVDDVGRYVVEQGKPAYYEIVDYFGTGVLFAEGSINRKKLGEIVFSDNAKLQKLNDITHKYIFKEVQRQLIECKENNINDIVIDAALLFEIGLNRLVDEIWYVEAEKDERFYRLIKRDNYTNDQAKRRIESQHFLSHKRESDVIIENNRKQEDLEEQIISILNK